MACSSFRMWCGRAVDEDPNVDLGGPIKRLQQVTTMHIIWQLQCVLNGSVVCGGVASVLRCCVVRCGAAWHPNMDLDGPIKRLRQGHDNYVAVFVPLSGAMYTDAYDTYLQ